MDMKFERYESRVKAGQFMADFIRQENPGLWNSIMGDNHNYYCFAIPNGGIPVAEGFCSQLNIKYDLLIVRKIKIPWNTEAGFGSITTDGTILINQSLYDQLNLNEIQQERSIKLTKDEINERIKLYGKLNISDDSYLQKIQGKNIFMIDDGLASGFTMLAAIKMIRKYEPHKTYILIPTAPLRTVERLKIEVDEIFCPNVRDVLMFAVAEAYQDWYDVPELEVLEIIKVSKYYDKD